MVGTTAVVLDTIDRFAVDLDHELVAMPSPGGHYLVWAENGIAGRAVEHVLERVLVAPGGFDELEGVLTDTPAGSHGVLFLPWLDGSMAPRGAGHMRGGFLNLSVDTVQGDLVRALVEGTALNVGWLLPAVEAFSGHSVEEVVFGGGAAQSPGWAQVMADVLDRPVSVLRSPGAAAARAVACAALGLEPPPDVVDTRDPDPATREGYALLQEQFVAAFDAVRPIVEALGAKLGP
jgi:xylulokinase